MSKDHFHICQELQPLARLGQLLEASGELRLTVMTVMTAWVLGGFGMIWEVFPGFQG